MVNVHAGKVELIERAFANFGQQLFGHFFVGGVFYGLNGLAIDLISAHLPKEDRMSTNAGLRLMFGDGVCNEGG